MDSILSLFSDAVWSSLVINQSEQTSAPAVTQVTTVPGDCCVGCEYSGLCDSEECAAKLYPEVSDEDLAEQIELLEETTVNVRLQVLRLKDKFG